MSSLHSALPILWKYEAQIPRCAVTFDRVIVSAWHATTLHDIGTGKVMRHIPIHGVDLLGVDQTGFIIRSADALVGLSMDMDVMWKRDIPGFTHPASTQSFSALPNIVFQGRSYVWFNESIWEFDSAEGDLDRVDLPRAFRRPRLAAGRLWSLSRKRTRSEDDVLWSWDGTSVSRYVRNNPEAEVQGFVQVHAAGDLLMTHERWTDASGAWSIELVLRNAETFEPHWMRPLPTNNRASMSPNQARLGLSAERVFVHREPGAKVLACLSARDGRQLWETPINYPYDIECNDDLVWHVDEPLRSARTGRALHEGGLRGVRRLGDRLVVVDGHAVYCLDYGAVLDLARRV